MKVLMLNGSCNPKGCTYTALTEVGKTLTSAGIDYEIVQLGGGPVRDCIGCNQCSKNGCVFTDDGVNDFIAKARQADGFVFGTPVYYAHPSGRALSFLDRVFYAGGSAFAGKPGAAVASARRAGTTASLDALGKYFGISNMVTVGSTYWNMVDCCFSFQGKFFHFLAINRHREIEYNLLYPASVFSLFREHLNSLDKGFHKLFLFRFCCGMVDFIKCQ